MDSSSPAHIPDLLSGIIKNCWADFQQLKELHTTVKHSIPILWFGDLEAYNRSTIKILTVALNPSNKEFHDEKHSKSGIGVRFPAAESLAGKAQLDDSDVAAYYKAMNEYFEKCPYEKWFKKFETPLNVLNTTYCGKKADFANRAIHIDLMTPIATEPTWGDKKLNREPYLKTSHYFEDLIAIFDPQIILVSVGQKHIRQRLDDKFNEGKTYVVPRNLKDGRLMIAGRNMNGDPFSGMTYAYVRERMLAIKREYNLCDGESVTVQSTKADKSSVANDVHNKTEGGQEDSVVDERKVGEIARNDFRNILESGRVPDEEIARLTDRTYTQRTFGLSSYPVLSEVREGTMSVRYYANPLNIKGKTYYMCSQWTTRQLAPLLKWLAQYLRESAEVCLREESQPMESEPRRRRSTDAPYPRENFKAYLSKQNLSNRTIDDYVCQVKKEIEAMIAGNEPMETVEDLEQHLNHLYRTGYASGWRKYIAFVNESENCEPRVSTN